MTSYTEEDYIETGSGIAFHFLNPKTKEVIIDDVCGSLSKQCRYTGHTKKFYSVAEHCCHLYDYALATKEYSVQELRTILQHDASEAYLTDIARPIKAHIPDYKKLEVKIETVLAEKFDLLYPYPDWVRELDTRILMDERAQAMEPSNNVWGVVADPLEVELQFWDPPTAYKAYKSRFYETI
jgi:hypothetical protein